MESYIHAKMARSREKIKQYEKKLKIKQEKMKVIQMQMESITNKILTWNERLEVLYQIDYDDIHMNRIEVINTINKKALKIEWSGQKI